MKKEKKMITAKNISMSGIVVAAGSFISVPTAAETVRPNVLWITSEDNNIDWIGCYGNKQFITIKI